MFFGFFYYDWTILIVLPAMIFAFIAQARVRSTFEKYAKLGTHSGLTGADAARRLLNANGLYDVSIVRTEGHLTDHYDPRNKTLYLSREVHDMNTTSAIGERQVLPVQTNTTLFFSSVFSMNVPTLLG